MNLDSKICTIGGGSGMPIVNMALVKAGFKNINSIVTTFDSGGDTGRIRTDERGNVLAFSDYWRSLMSLWVDGEKKETWEKMLKYRDGRGRNFGNVFFQFMSEKMGNLSKVDNLFIDLTVASLNGKVVPVSLDPAEVCFTTKSGRNFKGEHILDDLRMSKDRIEDIWLEPNINANIEAIDVINNSDVIIVCPGSMFGSVIVNLLPIGIKEAFLKSSSKKILMTNIMSVANENDHFTQIDYLKIFEKYLDMKNVFYLVVMPDFSVIDNDIFEKVKQNYDLEYSYPILASENCPIKTMVADIAVVDENNYRIRHSEDKLSLFYGALNL